MSIHTCRDYPTDPNCTCFTQTNEQIHHYRQFNKSKQNYNCCDSIYINPAEVRVSAGCCYGLTSTVEYLQYINDNNLTNCDYSKYFGGITNTSEIKTYMLNNNRELYDNAEVNFQIYQQFYCIPNSSTPGTGTSPPIPVFSDHNVSCTAPYIPYLVSYKTELQNAPFPQYTYICNQSQTFDQINLSNGPLNYEVYHIYRNTNTPCVTSSCPTSYESGNYNNLANQGAIYQGKKSKNNEVLLGVGITLLIITIIVYGVIGYHMYEKNTKFKGNVKKSNTYNNPTYEN